MTRPASLARISPANSSTLPEPERVAGRGSGTGHEPARLNVEIDRDGEADRLIEPRLRRSLGNVARLGD